MESTDHKFLFFKETDITERESYEYFKKNKRFTHKPFDEYKKWVKIAKGLMHAMNLLSQEYDAGVYFQELGYLLFLPKYKVKGRRISLLRRKPDRFYYEQSFIPLCDELISFRTEGHYLTDKVLIPDLKRLDKADEFYKQLKYLKGKMNFLSPSKYFKI